MDTRTARVNHHRGAKDQLCVPQMFTWGHVAQLDRVLDESIPPFMGGRCRTRAGGRSPWTWDSTIVRLRLKKQGARSVTPVGVAITAWRRLPAPEEVVGVRLRAATPIPVGALLAFSPRCSTVCAGRGQPGRWCESRLGLLQLQGDPSLRQSGVSYSVTVKTSKASHKVIAAISEEELDHRSRTGSTTVPMWPRRPTGPFPQKHLEVRLIVRRVKPTPGSQPGAVFNLRLPRLYHDREGETIYLVGRSPPPRVVEDVIRDLKYGVGVNHLPSGRFCANAVWMTLNVIAHNLGAGWVASASGPSDVHDHQDPAHANVEHARTYDHLWRQKDPALPRHGRGRPVQHDP